MTEEPQLPAEEANKSPVTPEGAMAFIHNLDLLGLPVSTFTWDAGSHQFILEFNHPFFVIRFFDTVIMHIWSDYTAFIGSNGITIDADDFPKIKKGIAKFAKKNKDMKEIDPMESEIAYAMNKVAHVLLDEMDVSMDFNHPMMAGFKSSISPDNQEMLTVLTSLLPNLCPRELGGIQISFRNTPGVIRFDFPDRGIH